MHHAKCTKQDHRAAIEVEACCIGKRISLLRVANCKRGCWSSWNTVVSRRLLLQARQGEQRILGEFSPVTPWPPIRFQRVHFARSCCSTLFVVGSRFLFFFFLVTSCRVKKQGVKGVESIGNKFQCCIRMSFKKMFYFIRSTRSKNPLKGFIM